ncbi:YbaB/EbfC family nucleoid-associated protein [Actinophytocola gossypii]|uniref:YbaB/EbfC family nucleoid-associated protein n=1 Tax=Actinophytocola gossypii TaxID=2812003 RepID=A0ABT2JEL2_9PSEU|nr:YbaB/EbfC family nucleoid-associated protein [Actinophytocola gossypii]MCT2586302.1 YbaB/EbfC family nucleoid-associated protein [Actinophytocola gossypii]
MDAIVDRVLDEIGAAKRAIAEVEASADSPDGLVTATVNGGGELVELELDPRIYREHDTRALATRIRAAVGEAHALAGQRVRAVYERLGRRED